MVKIHFIKLFEKIQLTKPGQRAMCYIDTIHEYVGVAEIVQSDPVSQKACVGFDVADFHVGTISTPGSHVMLEPETEESVFYAIFEHRSKDESDKELVLNVETVNKKQIKTD